MVVADEEPKTEDGAVIAAVVAVDAPKTDDAVVVADPKTDDVVAAGDPNADEGVDSFVDATDPKTEDEVDVIGVEPKAVKEVDALDVPNDVVAPPKANEVVLDADGAVPNADEEAVVVAAVPVVLAVVVDAAVLITGEDEAVMVIFGAVAPKPEDAVVDGVADGVAEEVPNMDIVGFVPPNKDKLGVVVVTAVVVEVAGFVAKDPNIEGAAVVVGFDRNPDKADVDVVDNPAKNDPVEDEVVVGFGIEVEVVLGFGIEVEVVCPNKLNGGVEVTEVTEVTGFAGFIA